MSKTKKKPTAKDEREERWNIRPATDANSPLRRNPRNEDAGKIRDFTVALENAHRVDIAALLDRIRDGQAGQSLAANLDGVGGPSATAWCETHEQDVQRCLKTCAHHGCDLDQCRRDVTRKCYRTRDCFGVPARGGDCRACVAAGPEGCEEHREGTR